MSLADAAGDQLIDSLIIGNQVLLINIRKKCFNTTIKLRMNKSRRTSILQADIGKRFNFR